MATQTQTLTRRRFLSVCASSAALASLPGYAAKPLHQWRGILLGADVQLHIAHENKDAARALFSRCVKEIKRLENIFTLYDQHSELSQLNREGALPNPSADMLAIMHASIAFNHATHGAFDITMRPLETGSIAPVGIDKLDVGSHSIAFTKPGMQVSLNGIAQGYITDIITELLKHEGLQHVLVELGEKRALGAHPTGRDWRLQLAGTDIVVPLRGNAMAVSSSYSPNDGLPHIYNPATGNFETRNRSIAVTANSAAKADAMATGLITLDKETAKQIARTEQLTIMFI